ncbi:MAG: LacI family DNA-binding transcriptional regulator [Alphaproteobacteria bacterium]
MRDGKGRRTGGDEVGIRAIAAAAAVSIATVSRVVNGHPSVSPEMRERVQATIARLAYRPNIVARSLRTRQSGSFGVIVPNISNEHFTDIVRSIQDAAETKGFTTLILNTDNAREREEAAIRSLLARHVEGIAIVSCEAAATPALREAIRAGVPVVAMDRRIEEPGIDQVTINTRQGTREAVLHLAAQGRRRIAFIAGPQHLWTAAEKRAGYREGLRMAGLDFAPDLVLPGDYGFATGERQTRAMLDAADRAGGARPDALIAANNLMAFGAMRALLRDGVAVPRDLAFIGLDDTIWTDVIKPGISVVAQPTAELGRETVRLLSRRIANGRRTGPGERVVLQTSLVLRESTEGEG